MEERIILLLQFSMELAYLWIGLTVLFGGKLGRIWIAIIGCILFASIVVLSHIPIVDLSLLRAIFILIICFIISKPPEAKNRGWCLGNMFILLYLEGLLYMIVNDIAYYCQKGITEDIVDLLSSILSMCVIAIASYVCSRYKKFLKNLKIGSYMRKCTIPLVVFLAIEIVFIIMSLEVLIENSGNERQRFIIMILSFLSMVSIGIMVVMVVIVLYIKKRNEKMEQLLMMEQYMQQLQVDYYESLLDKEEATRKYRHDMKNHLICLNRFVSDGDLQGTKEYIKKMFENMEDIQNSGFDTGINILNVFLDYYIAQIEEGVLVKIKGKCKVRVAVSDIDMCTIFSNLIQNAVEAINCSEQDKRFFRVEISQGRKFVQIQIINSVNANSLQLDEKGNLQTGKRDKRNHGIGMLNVKETIDKNKGIFQYRMDTRQFFCEVFLPLE